MMTVEDLKRLTALPGDPAQLGFDSAVMAAAADLADAAAGHRGLRAALHEAVLLVFVGIALGTDRPRATLHMLIAELTEQAEEMLSQVSPQARHDA